MIKNNFRNSNNFYILSHVTKIYFFFNIINKLYLQIKKLLNKIEDEWKLWKSKEEITIMENYAKEGRFYIIGYISKIS